MDSILAWRSQESVESAQDWQSEAHPGSGKSSFFFLSDGCMAQRGRCPGGRPSVSAKKRVQHAYYSVLKWQLYKPSMNTEYDQQSPRECRYLYWQVQ